MNIALVVFFSGLVVSQITFTAAHRSGKPGKSSSSQSRESSELQCFNYLVGDIRGLPRWMRQLITIKRRHINRQLNRSTRSSGSSSGDKMDKNDKPDWGTLNPVLAVLTLRNRQMRRICATPRWFKRILNRPEEEVEGNWNKYDEWFENWYKAFKVRRNADCVKYYADGWVLANTE